VRRIPSIADEPLVSRWSRNRPWFAGLRLRLDAVREMLARSAYWTTTRIRSAICSRCEDSGAGRPKTRHGAGGCHCAGVCWLTWQVRRELNPPSRISRRGLTRGCARSSPRRGIPRLPHEGARPTRCAWRVYADLANTVTALCRQYSFLRYAAPSTSVTVANSKAAVRAFPSESDGLSPRARNSLCGEFSRVFRN